MKKIFLLLLCSFVLLTAFAQLKENVGIGVRLRLDSSRGYKMTMVVALIPDGAAEKAGLLAGDMIVKVNDKSTKNMLLKDVTDLIVGEAGTGVKLVIERNGAMKNFSVTRGKYKYAESFYQPAVKDNEFCTALAKLMNDAGYDFANTMDKNAKDINGDQVSKVKIPGAQITGMKISVGTYCEADFGSFSSRDEVNTKGTVFMNQVKNCFPDFYYEPDVDKNGTITINIGRQYKSGTYESPILQFFTYQDKSQKHKLILRINGGKPTTYYSIEEKAADNSFAKALRAIYNDVPSSFRNVKGKKHEAEGGLFSSGSAWYEITPLPDGAKSCSVSEGGMSLGAKNCSCGFYQGSDRTDAVNTFNDLVSKMKTSLGPDFVYSYDKNEWDMNISKNAEAVVTFGVKKKKAYESNVPLIVLLYEVYENGTYGVRMLFYQTGF